MQSDTGPSRSADEADLIPVTLRELGWLIHSLRRLLGEEHAMGSRRNLDLIGELEMLLDRLKQARYSSGGTGSAAQPVVALRLVKVPEEQDGSS